MRAVNHGSLILLTPETPEELEWVRVNVEVEPWAWLGGSFSCEPRFAGEILAGCAAEVG